MLGIYVNEMQRNVNGFGQAGGYYDTRIVPYGHFRPYSPRDARGVGRTQLGRVSLESQLRRSQLKRARRRRSQLGDIPNDFEASVDLQYIPVRQGWYYGAPVDGRGYPDGGFGQAVATAAEDGTGAQRLVELQRLAKLERTQTILQAVSTASIAIIATLAITKAVITVRRRGHEALGDEW